MALRSTALARNLRRKATDAEKAMWRLLRNRQLAGCKFRRQVPLGDYIVDFVCYERDLVVEIDGGYHQMRTTEDAERTACLESQGFRVVRFWNNQVLSEPEAVLEAILLELQREDSPSP